MYGASQPIKMRLSQLASRKVGKPSHIFKQRRLMSLLYVHINECAAESNMAFKMSLELFNYDCYDQSESRRVGETLVINGSGYGLSETPSACRTEYPEF
jgi:hypothetical protein